METLFFIIYIAAGWWALNKIWYSNHTYFVTDTMRFYVMKFIWVFLLGWIAIPIAIIMTILGK